MSRPTAISPEEQEQIARRIGVLLLQAAPEDWQQITVEYRATGEYHDLLGEITSQDGTGEAWEPPDELLSIFEHLREGMYRPDVGTWLSALYIVEKPSSYRIDINFDAEPRWQRPLPRAAYVDELRRYPRAEENIPDWLRERLEGSGAAPQAGTADPAESFSTPQAPPSPEEPAGSDVPHFRTAAVFDDVDEHGRPLVTTRVPVPPDELPALRQYLENAPIVLASRDDETDRLNPEHPDTVPATWHTDGVWLWQGAVPYYLAQYGVPPETALIEHIRTRSFVLPELDDRTRDAATRELFERSAADEQRGEAAQPSWQEAAVGSDGASAPEVAPTSDEASSESVVSPTAAAAAAAASVEGTAAEESAALPEDPASPADEEFRIASPSGEADESAHATGEAHIPVGGIESGTPEAGFAQDFSEQGPVPSGESPEDDVDAAELGAADVGATGLDAADVDATGLDAADVDAAGLGTADVGASAVNGGSPEGDVPESHANDHGPVAQAADTGLPQEADTEAPQDPDPAAGTRHERADLSGQEDEDVLALLHDKLTEFRVDTDTYRIGSHTPEAVCLLRDGSEWVVTASPDDHPGEDVRFAHSEQAAAYLLGSLLFAGATVTTPDGVDAGVQEPVDDLQDEAAIEHLEVEQTPSAQDESIQAEASHAEPAEQFQTGQAAAEQPELSRGESPRASSGQPEATQAASWQPETTPAGADAVQPVSGSDETAAPERPAVQEPPRRSSTGGHFLFTANQGPPPEPESEAPRRDAAPAAQEAPTGEEATRFQSAPRPEQVGPPAGQQPPPGAQPPPGGPPIQGQGPGALPKRPPRPEQGAPAGPDQNGRPPAGGPAPQGPMGDRRPGPAPGMGGPPRQAPGSANAPMNRPAPGDPAARPPQPPVGQQPQQPGQQAGGQQQFQPLRGEPPLTLYRDRRPVMLQPGTDLDRFGDPAGNVTYAIRTPFSHRSLPPQWSSRPCLAYRVQRPIQALRGTAVPWFEQPGGGTAYVLPASVGDLVADGTLVELTGNEAPPPPME